MFQKLIHNIKERHFGGMRRQTQKLDAQTRDNLREFLEDVPEEVAELYALNQELDQAHERLSKLSEKEKFVGQRLESYQRKLENYQAQRHARATSKVTEGGDATDHPEPVTSETTKTEDEQDEDQNYEKYLNALKQVEISHKTLERGVEVLQEKIELMEHRQAELRHLTDECQVVYETTEALRALESPSMPLPSTNELSISDAAVATPVPAEEEPAVVMDEEEATAIETDDNDDNEQKKGNELELAKRDVEAAEPTVSEKE